MISPSKVNTKILKQAMTFWPKKKTYLGINNDLSISLPTYICKYV